MVNKTYEAQGRLLSYLLKFSLTRVPEAAVSKKFSQVIAVCFTHQ